MVLAIDALATWRLVRLAQEDLITADLREKWIIKHGAGFWGPLASCPHCLAVWVGLGAVALRTVAPRIWGPIAAGLASSAGASLITMAVDRLESHDPRE